ncbi:MAG: c-type cytochrome biogenesis protein CcmI [Gammaproteobacteria bacterium]|nr:c-type cytochrome biogenesis protein CcmI [Gammaproteobacteria bacterium]
MVGFWAVAAVFILIAFAFLLPPLFKKRDTSSTVARKDLTVTVYQDQFTELDNDLKNEVISHDQYLQAKTDLEKNLLEDIGKAKKADDEENDRPSPLGNKIGALVIVLAIPVLTLSLYGEWGAGVEAIDPDSIPEEVKAANQKHNQKETIEKMLIQLEQRLKDDPNDGEGWFMLARSYQFLKRHDDAVVAFEKSLPLGGNQSADVLSSYADAVAMAANRQLTDKAVDVLKQAVAIDPVHVKSLWLLGTAFYQNKNYPDALKYWERLHMVLTPGSDDANQIAMNIGEVRSVLGLPPMEVGAAVSSLPVPAAMNAEISDVRVQGSVSLSGAIASKASPEDIVFVFARAATGPRMPLAIIRKQVKDLPFDFTLDDSLAMNPSMKISSVPQVVVGARISKSGNAMPQPGDLQGASNVITLADNKAVKIIIGDEVK